MSLLDANMVCGEANSWFADADEVEKIPFQSSYYMLITMGLLILAGNTW